MRLITRCARTVHDLFAYDRSYDHPLIIPIIPMKNIRKRCSTRSDRVPQTGENRLRCDLCAQTFQLEIQSFRLDKSYLTIVVE